jgi:hypothetical protein
MRTAIYDDTGAKSTTAEGSGVIEAFNGSITRLIQEVDLDQSTVRELMTVKLGVNREVRRLAGHQ